VQVSATAKVVVEARPNAVFAVLADPWSYAQWVCGTQEIRAADPDWPRVGARLWHRFGRRPLRSFGTTEVLAWEPPGRLVLCADVAPLALVRATMTVCPIDGRCLVYIREDMIGGPLRWFGPVTALAQRWRNAVSLQRLARLATSSPTRPAPSAARSGPRPAVAAGAGPRGSRRA
jgi:hypothetical protein